jgi:GNAT superfamily N-acetyltransferase
VEIREARRGDEAAVADIHVRAWQAAYRGLLPGEFLDALRPEERAARYTFGATGPGSPCTLLALEGEEVLGFSTFGPSRDVDAPGAGELYALYVDPSRWRAGAGRLLLARTRERLHAAGHEQAILWVLVGNTGAERFYEADGWRRDGARRLEDPWGVLSEVLRYRRGLP